MNIRQYAHGSKRKAASGMLTDATETLKFRANLSVLGASEEKGQFHFQFLSTLNAMFGVGECARRWKRALAQ
ncbi:MAG: hypothetical protein Q8J92_08525 [Parvibaculum sp.]|nr:hypothetical protein [Parvibaculum sp.]